MSQPILCNKRIQDGSGRETRRSIHDQRQWSDEELAHHLNAEAKKYIADNNIQLYTINAIDKAIEIGMGKRTNTILQSAFFKLLT